MTYNVLVWLFTVLMLIKDLMLSFYFLKWVLLKQGLVQLESDFEKTDSLSFSFYEHRSAVLGKVKLIYYVT